MNDLYYAYIRDARELQDLLNLRKHDNRYRFTVLGANFEDPKRFPNMRWLLVQASVKQPGYSFTVNAHLNRCNFNKEPMLMTGMVSEKLVQCARDFEQWLCTQEGVIDSSEYRV